MPTPGRADIELFVEPGKMEIPYRYHAGAVGSRFLIELRDRQKILGIRCPACNKVYVPPKSTCIHCFAKLDEWVELGNEGTLTSFAVVYQPEPPHPLKPPFTYGIVQLDGADTGLVHFIGEAEAEDLRSGMRVQAVFKEDRSGSILDIKYFKPA